MAENSKQKDWRGPVESEYEMKVVDLNNIIDKSGKTELVARGETISLDLREGVKIQAYENTNVEEQTRQEGTRSSAEGR